MKVKRRGDESVVRINDDPPECSCRPSVDYLFRSAAEAYPGGVVGVIMTGMGSDGTIGCRSLRSAGARIICQDERSSVVYGMPRGPVDEGTCDEVLPLGDIAGRLVRILQKRRAA